jgi:hypothetical protein
MRFVLVSLPVALFAATPAFATGSLICRTAGAHPIEVQMVIGLTAVSNIVQARLNDDGKDVPVVVAQSWIEQHEVRLDLTDPNAERHELRLRAKARRNGYDGSIWRRGTRRWVRCSEG